MPVDNLLKVEITPLPEAVLVKLIGEARLDVERAGILLDRGVIVHHPRIVVIDCSELTFISSIGMSLLLNLRRSVDRDGGVVRLAAVGPMVHGALQHATLLGLFEVYPDVKSAVAHRAEMR